MSSSTDYQSNSYSPQKRRSHPHRRSSSNSSSDRLGTAELEYENYRRRRAVSSDNGRRGPPDDSTLDSSLRPNDTVESSIVALPADSGLVDMDAIRLEYERMKMERRDRRNGDAELTGGHPAVRERGETPPSRPPLDRHSRQSSPPRDNSRRTRDNGDIIYDDYESDSVVEMRRPRRDSRAERSMQMTRDKAYERDYDMHRRQSSGRRGGNAVPPNPHPMDRRTSSDRRKPTWGPDATLSDEDDGEEGSPRHRSDAPNSRTTQRRDSISIFSSGDLTNRTEGASPVYGVAASVRALRAGNGSSPGGRGGTNEDTSDSLEHSLRTAETDEESGQSGLLIHRGGVEGPFRGFHSSISDLFKDETVACGALACCGLLVSTRTEYVLKRRSGPSKVVSICLLLSITFFSLTYLVFPAPIGKRDGYDDDGGDDGSKMNGELARFWTVFIFFGVLGTYGRRYRVKMRANILHRDTDGALPWNSPKSAEHGWESACAHSLLGCYPADGNDPDDDESTQDGTEIHNMAEQIANEDCCMRFYRWFSNLCCGKILHCWIQVCGICAIAQEAREVRKLAPREMWMIDYITFQPFIEYNRSIVQLRNQQNGSLFSHLGTLSKLSVYIIIFFVLVIALVSSVLYINLDDYTIANGTILVLTFVQSFLVVFIVHWIHHRFDLSLDAVVKMFAAGFTLGFPVAYCIEMVIQIAVKIVDTIGYYLCILIGGESFDYFFADNLLAFDIVAQLVQSFVVAALTEELVKFYITRAIEHPDLNKEVLLANGHPVDASASMATPTSLLGLAKGRNDDTRSIRGRSAAITISMICVAVGFACAENLCYVFSSGMNGSASQQFLILFVRSIFPVHALAAAMQSVSVVQRDIEGMASLKVGKIVLPAVLFHGVFDSCIFVVAAIGTDLGESLQLIVVALMATLTTMIIGLLWYIRTSKNQLSRLLLIEQMQQTNYNHPSESGTEEWSPRSDRSHSDKMYMPPQSETGTTFETQTQGSQESEYNDRMFRA